MYILQYSYIISKREPFNSNILSKNPFTQIYNNKRTKEI